MAITLENKAITQTCTVDDWRPRKAYRFHILLLPEDDGSLSAVVLNLPGIGSCGDKEEEAIENAKEAIQAALESYAEAGEGIPWKDNTSLTGIPPGAKQRWIILDA